MAVHVSLATTTQNRILLEKIREFLLAQLDEHSHILGSSTKLINILNKTEIGNNKPISVLEISQIDYIHNILIPYLDNLQFNTKKFLDYLDFRTIVLLIFQGKHLSNEGKELILKLANTMNNNRLSTNSSQAVLDETLAGKLDTLIKSEPLIVVDSEGWAMVIKEKKNILDLHIL